jgi:DNA-binding LacI/PurR family transcriptional regulator
LDLETPPTAIFLANDLMALGAYKATMERGLAIPSDLSIIGVDDVFFTPYLSPPLTTIQVPTRRAGSMGIQLLLEKSREEKPVERVVLPTQLIVRESTATPSLLKGNQQQQKPPST